MYSSFTLLKKYIQYWLKAENGKGHGVHSPFVYSFIKQVLNTKVNHAFIPIIEKRRAELEQESELVEVWDRGAGSRQNNSAKRTVQQIAKAALKPKKYSQLLYKIIAYYQPAAILEMGTSLGITTCYLAVAHENAQVVTMEGAPNVAAIARKTLDAVGVKNVQIVEGDFDQTLATYLQGVSQLGLAYVDGNHRYESTMRYFEQLLSKSNEDTVLIFDDIHWSKEMEKAWEEIKANPQVTLTIDLFFIGLVFVRKAQKEKEHFIIRY